MDNHKIHTKIEANTRQEDKIHAETRSGIHKITRHKNNVVSAEKHFAKVCRSESVNYLQNKNDDQPSADDDQFQILDLNYPVPFADFTSENGWEELQRDNFFILAIAEAFKIKTSAKITDGALHEHIVKLKTKADDIFAIADSGSPKVFLNEKQHAAYNKMTIP